MIEEIDADPIAAPSLPPRRFVIALAAATFVAAAVVAIVALDRGGGPLALSADVVDVELTALPDRIANEPPASSLREPIAIRATTGLASVEGPATIAWTERGIAYRLESSRLVVADLVRIAASLR